MGNISAKTKHTRSQPSPSELYVTLTKPGVTQTDLIRRVYENRPHRLRSIAEAEAVFRLNNDLLTGGLPARSVVTLNSTSFSDYAISQWHRNKHGVERRLRSTPELYDYLSTTSVRQQTMMEAVVEKLEKAKWVVGKKAHAALNYSTAAASGLTAAEKMPLVGIQRIAREMAEEARSQMGKSIFSKKNIKTLDAFLKSSPKYQTLQKEIAELPKWLKKDLGHFCPSPRAYYADAKFVKQQIVLPFNNPQLYCDRFAHLLDNKIVRLGIHGLAWTYVVPATVTLFDVSAAAPGKKVQTASSDTAGILLGAVGTPLGAWGGLVIAGLLGLSGAGVILAIFIGASAGGYILSDIGSNLTDWIFKEIGW